jgi:hypothetical protein
MRRNLIIRHLALTIALGLPPAFARADVVIRCYAGDAVTYTNGPCPDDTHPAEVIPQKEVIVPAVTPITRTIIPTRWAQPIPHRHNKPDVATIRSARVALKLMDQEHLEQQHLRLAFSN